MGDKNPCVRTTTCTHYKQKTNRSVRLHRDTTRWVTNVRSHFGSKYCMPGAPWRSVSALRSWRSFLFRCFMGACCAGSVQSGATRCWESQLVTCCVPGFSAWPCGGTTTTPGHSILCLSTHHLGLSRMRCMTRSTRAAVATNAQPMTAGYNPMITSTCRSLGKIVEFPEILIVQGFQTFENLRTAAARHM